MNQELEKIVGIVQAKDLTFEYIRRDETLKALQQQLTTLI